MMKTTGVLVSGYHHDTGHHPESAERLRAIEVVYAEGDLASRLTRIEPRRATVEELGEVHDGSYIRQVEEACKRGVTALDPDTMICSRSYDEACLAAGGVMAMVDEVQSTKVANGFCAVRPPGHHAERNRAMGFCLFNNVAVAARYAQRLQGIERVLIVDWDVHHGNGTQNTFYADPSVFYCSIHQEHHYPGTGHARQEGKDHGAGSTLNVPLHAGCGDDEYLAILDDELIPAMENFRPDLVLVSAGFDAHKDDPLAGMSVTTAGFGQMTNRLTDLAATYCGGKIVSVLEGGYNLAALQESVRAHLEALTRAP
ncbi:MAG: histone deacetylase [bacterium]|nr:histone deacetylase [bacterium]